MFPMNQITKLTSIVTDTHSSPTAAVIFLHGLGADGYDFVDIVSHMQLPSQLGVRFIFPHAPVRPVTLNNGYTMRAWYDIYSLNSLNREDQAGLLQSQQAIILLIQELQTVGILASRIILAGFSQGGAMALHTGLHYPQTLGGIIGLSTYLPLATYFKAETTPANRHTPIFLAHGHYDNVLPYQVGETVRELLQKAGYPVEWHGYPIAHESSAAEINDMSRWLQKILL